MPFIILLFFIYSISSYIDLSQLGVYIGCPWYNYFAYNFIHVNLLHLIANSLLFLFYWKSIRRMNRYVAIPIIVIVSTLASILSVYSQPTIGLSASVMSMAGIITATLPKRTQIKIVTLFALSCTITALFASNINTLIHIYSFAFSLIVSLVVRRFLYDRN